MFCFAGADIIPSKLVCFVCNASHGSTPHCVLQAERNCHSVRWGTAMGRVRKVTGEEALTEEEFAAWWKQHHLQRDSFVNALRRRVARQMKIGNFRLLALVCGDQVLGAESPWMDAELVVVVRPYSTDGQDELFKAVGVGDMETVVSLLEKPLDPEDRNRSMLALHFAAMNGHAGIARCLVQAGADKDVANDLGWTPMHFAASHGHKDTVRCLLEACADKDKADLGGYTPMHCAATSGHKDTVGCLVEAGADKDKVNHAGYTPLHEAAKSGHEDIVRSLVKAGAKDKANYSGATAMQVAATYGHEDIAKFLLQHARMRTCCSLL